ncbi:MAG: DUF4328 domain-containing protein [Actinobacteria bacterium]|uniref:Unannotated protein n=1 Tax=freshwater metagenome TaxID=449393 RepID=A0A6J6RH33_9ZZZZ|nr:DUF4328 domain-containing protein [Actinomycetota bacterium]MSW77274.1 DUF4328 domain-containing protein [Actinomycetota bacterium]MSX55047.1 DUF4328 domain-containing protein [Actinomycetota bacterium]MSX93963.1 DUF4328 domain-containing protein [Actinomycetota bacterium]MSZ82795.1 DUF4328 domain-containing protein [Actinomycetota bacterium]
MSDLPPPPPNMSPPPGYVAYGGGFNAATGSFRRVGTLGKWLAGLIGVSIVAQAALVLVQFSLKAAAKNFLANGDVSQFNTKLAAYVGVGLVVTLIGVAQLVILCIWTWRMAKNAEVLGRQPQRFRPGTTIAINILGGCTLGILPFFMWRELWQASDPEVAAGDPNWKRNLFSPLIALHLALTLAAVAAGLAMGVGGLSPVRANGTRDDIAKNITDKLTFVGLTGALTIAASVVFMLLVREFTARHKLAIREA